MNPIFPPASETEIQKKKKNKKKKKEKKRKVQEQSGLAKRMKGSRRGEERDGGRVGEGGSGVELSAEVVSGVAGGPETEQQQPSKGPLRLFSPLN